MKQGLENDKKLVELAKENPSCFVDLYDKYFDCIYRYVYRRVGSVENTEDLVSQTFYDALYHLGNYQYRGYPFSSWLYKIAHNNVLKWYRSNLSGNKVDLDDIADLRSDDDVVNKVLVNDEHSRVLSKLEKLDYEDRELIRLKYFEEVSNIEIGRIMGITANNVGVKLYRALKKLKQLMG